MKWKIIELDNNDSNAPYQYVVEIVDYKTISLNTFNEIKKWLIDNNIPNREHSSWISWFFEVKDDAVLFLLRWSD